MSQSQPSRPGSLLLLLAAVIGFAVALYAWLTPSPVLPVLLVH